MEQALEEDRPENLAEMKGKSDAKGALRVSGQAAPGNNKQTHSLEPDASTTDSPVMEKASSSRITRSRSDAAVTLPIRSLPGSNVGSSDFRVQFQDQTAKTGERKRSIDPSEAVRRGLDFGPLKKTVGRHNSTTGILKTSSKSPSSRLSRISLSSTDEILSSTGVGRLKKDYYANDADGEDAIESSDEDSQIWSSGDEVSGSGRARGRRREVRSPSSERTSPKSPLATVDADQPAVTVTAPEGSEKPTSTAKRFIVRPNTNYDRNVSRDPSPHTSDSEEINDIRRAQRLNINSSPIDSSIPHRVIQTIIRGDFAQMQREAGDDTRRLRTYLVATDLSEKSAYALEWTIGTVLRDGDTLLAVYAVDEEVGTGKTGESLSIGEGGKAIQDTTAVIDKMTAASQKGPLISLPSPLSKTTLRPGSRKSSAACSADSRALSKAEQERSHAIETLSDTCLRFLRKTKLQVRLAIEVIHCKSPKYMITEAVSLGFIGMWRHH